MLRKTVVVLVSVFVIAGLFPPAGFSAGMKIGYIDFRQVLSESKKAGKLRTEIEKMREDVRAKRTKMIEEITKLRDEGELLSGDAKKKKQTQIDAKLVELQGFDRENIQMLKSKEEKMLQEVLDDIQKVVDAVGKSGRYDYIMYKQAIIYANDALDITDEIVKKINK